MEWGGPIFPEPLLYSGAALWFILLIAALVGLMYYRQKVFDERLVRRRAPEHIYVSIRRTLDLALMKTGDETMAAGRRVQEALEQHLGPLLLFSHALGGPSAKLRKALSGKAEVVHAPVKHEPHVDRIAQPAVVVASDVLDRVTITPAQILTEGGHRDHGGHGGHDAGHGGHGHHEVEMSAREQRVAVREALEQLSDYWRKEPVERDLRAIQDALLTRGFLNSPPVRAARVRNAEAKLLFGPLAPRRPPSPPVRLRSSLCDRSPLRGRRRRFLLSLGSGLVRPMGMKLASLKSGRDGALVVVSSDLAWYAPA